MLFCNNQIMLQYWITTMIGFQNDDGFIFSFCGMHIPSAEMCWKSERRTTIETSLKVIFAVVVGGGIGVGFQFHSEPLLSLEKLNWFCAHFPCVFIPIYTFLVLYDIYVNLVLHTFLSQMLMIYDCLPLFSSHRLYIRALHI